MPQDWLDVHVDELKTALSTLVWPWG